MNKFKVGDHVKILMSSKWYGKGDNNPSEIMGFVVTITDEKFGVKVEWEDNTKNSYEEEDLGFFLN